MRRNLVFSLGYNVVGVALAMTGVLNPLVAAILMPLSLADRDPELVPGAHLRPGRRGGGPPMSVMFVLLPVALLFAGAAVGVFVWAARAGQFDDLETPAVRILHDDD